MIIPIIKKEMVNYYEDIIRCLIDADKKVSSKPHRVKSNHSVVPRYN